MKRVLILIALLSFFLTPAIAHACSCLTSAPAVEFNKAKAVFIGRMLGGTEKLSVKGQDGKAYSIEAGMVRFTMEEVFKGDAANNITIEIASMAGTSCGPYGLTRGERYVVYAYASEQDPKILYSGVCTRTISVTSGYAKEDLEFLRNLPPPGVGGTLQGGVWADLRDGDQTPLPNVKVNIRGEDGKVITAITNDKGKFEVKPIKAGTYRVEPEFPPNYMTEQHAPAEVTVDDRGTATVGFEAYLNGRISGRVVDKDGRASNSAFLQLEGEGKTVYGDSTGKNGEFKAEGVPPGDYFLYIEMRHKDYEKSRKFYYPGTFKPEEATAIKVGLGEKVEGIEFTLPDEFKVRTIEGQVVWTDGQPAANVEVLLLCPQSSRAGGLAVEFSPTSATTDEQGRFQLEAFTGETYWLEARGAKEESKKGEEVERHSPAKKTVMNENLQDIKLVLSETGLTNGCKK